MRPIDIDSSLYEAQLEEKAQEIQTLFEDFPTPQIDQFSSKKLHYRMRAEFRIWHDGDDLYHIMFDPDTKEQYRVDHFPPGSELINQAMRRLIEEIQFNDTLRRKLYQVDYLTGLSGELLISLIYRRQLDDAWLIEAKKLKQTLQQEMHVDLIGRARKQKLLLDRDYIIEELNIDDKTYTFKQIENSFTQPNAEVNQKMICWAKSLMKTSDHDLLELYCGAGNFSLPLARNYRKVLATEIAKSSVNAAQFNIAQNHIENVDIIQMSSEEFSEHIANGAFEKKMKGIKWQDYDCKTVLVDPPRSGLDAGTLALVSQFDNIIYISCNPLTLKENLDELSNTHSLCRLAIFDQFPYTHHTEVGVFLQRKN
ncbi:tRNA (uridine(54)-C5)-methyltransferase TrmA [Alteromonas sp. a30]|uniref:tRNA (uridine(54)-C5)-methyltransferase TrmA n=1 Tax=Alteromonas sp. a30 TaxID=2730917 RepID=UPI0022806E14|nr:tRNA (uridine(54)-C5)-methyltransferase TrmA [Alteromonas sp. a30]MCY7296558.1 tRNA (uridine(54)-C5)-methyltransferase TrmA [Alteromonas sp. a30]